MKVVFTAAALRDLDQIAEWLTAHYPSIAPSVERRIRQIMAHLSRWPEGARRSAKRPSVRVIPVGKYPYKIFYRVTDEAVEILHVHHAAREPWDESATS